MQQPTCLEDLPSTPLDPIYEGPVHPSFPAWGVWIAIGLAIIIFETWATLTGHETMSEAVRRGPLWAKWFIGSGLVWLFLHLFVQK